jgi:hypothetical protein
MSFDELVNKNRIDYFVEIIKDPKFNSYTVEALALEVGFLLDNAFISHSRNTMAVIPQT